VRRDELLLRLLEAVLRQFEHLKGLCHTRDMMRRVEESRSS
jgi:hypothetical protein